MSARMGRLCISTLSEEDNGDRKSFSQPSMVHVALWVQDGVAGDDAPLMLYVATRAAPSMQAVGGTCNTGIKISSGMGALNSL